MVRVMLKNKTKKQKKTFYLLLTKERNFLFLNIKTILSYVYYLELNLQFQVQTDWTWKSCLDLWLCRIYFIRISQSYILLKKGKQMQNLCFAYVADNVINLFSILSNLFFFSSIFKSWKLITLQYCSGFCHTLTWISLGFTCAPHPDPPSHLPLHPIPLGLPSAPAPSTCLMHPTWTGDLFHPR